MKKFIIGSLFLAALAIPASAAFWIGQTTPSVAPPAYTGLLDQFATLGATWGFSNYKLSNSYAGNWGTIQRNSDSTTANIGFVNGLSDSASLTSFCSGTLCYVTTLNDQSGNAHNATCTNVRAFIATDGRIAISPQASGKCTVAYNAAFSTAKQEMFAVAQPMFLDSRPYQTGITTVATTGHVTSGSATITTVASSTGISAAAANSQPSAPGVQDGSGCLPGSGANSGTTNFTSIGASANLAFQPGNVTPSCSSTTDNLTFSNAVIGGVWVTQGPSAAIGSAYWGFGIAVNSYDPYASDSTYVVNATSNGATITGDGSNAGQLMRQTLAVWDFDTFSGKIYYDGTQISGGRGSNVSITYTTNVPITLFEAANGSDQLQQANFEQMVLINQTFATRTTVASFLQTQYSLTAPTKTYTDSNGFTYNAELLSSYPAFANAYGDYSYTDANGIVWNPQTGGYYGASGPSMGRATNINNSTTMARFVVQNGDSDINVTQAERTEEASSSAHVAPGQSASFAFQFVWDQYSAQTGDWCDINQVHYDNNNGNNTPDIFGIDCKNSKLQPFYSTTNCGSGITLTQGTVYAGQVELFYSTNHTSDTITVWLGTNGGTLTQQCTASGSLFPTDTGAYPKQGIYRGFPWANTGTLIVREMNLVWSNTANAFSSWRTSQPALPTHS